MNIFIHFPRFHHQTKIYHALFLRLSHPYTISYIHVYIFCPTVYNPIFHSVQYYSTKYFPWNISPCYPSIVGTVILRFPFLGSLMRHPSFHSSGTVSSFSTFSYFNKPVIIKYIGFFLRLTA